MIAEKERVESKRQQAQGIKIEKEKRSYQGRPILYVPDAKEPQEQAVYYQYRTNVTIWIINKKDC
ncbi:hypothetical protein [Bacillus cereus]|uniref:hypothetical protein n=1 Tax=Bacillus cereus TaxID=1396 RepID=UPI0003AAD2DD|nr:hypothetical protein [Bacillus cereus]